MFVLGRRFTYQMLNIHNALVLITFVFNKSRKVYRLLLELLFSSRTVSSDKVTLLNFAIFFTAAMAFSDSLFIRHHRIESGTTL